MNKTIIHMSDLHFRQNWDEDQGVVLDGFFKDLSKQLEPLDRSNVYIVFSGDFALKGGEQVLYENFFLQFDNELNELGIPKEQRICVPGNHDISQDIISKDLVNHEAVIAQKLNEKSFNDYVSNPPTNVLLKKFDNYKVFESEFANMGVATDTMSGAGWSIDDNIGVYCLNTSFCSSGGVKKDDKELIDYKRLAIDTRKLHAWNLNCKATTKILVMHHPIECLIEWAELELKEILHKNFSLCLSGHNHNQDILHSIHNDSSLVECSAPPLLTNKHGDLGYSMINVDPKEGVIDIVYRQWTKRRSFVSGVNFSNTDDGIVRINKSENKVEEVDSHHNKAIYGFVDRHLTKILEDALRSFPNQSILWVEPILNKVPETSSEANPERKIEPNIILSAFISNPKSTIIKALPQFGLTCLAHYFRKEAWCSQGSYWIYLDSNNLKTHSLEKSVQAEMQILGCEIKDVKCIILDSWSNREKKSLLLLQKLCELYQDIPIIVMQTISDAQILLNAVTDQQLDRDFEILYLWALSRGSIRKIVTGYNHEKYNNDIDVVITKITSDLEVLNLHRTPLNCLTLLKVSEVDFDENPVNRTELINRILFILFNIDHIPTYKGRPDLKDCEYVLGYFCETMFREEKYTFTRREFLARLQSFCKEKVIDLDVEVVFDVLHLNNILVEREGSFCFRFSYWIFYFTAQRMHHDEKFANFILENMLLYASFPEILEFYTGIDRRREDALKILIKDLQSINSAIDEKLGLPKELNPYKFAQWKPSLEGLEKVQNELTDGVMKSHLPDSVKDQYADRNYDKTRPYHQEIQNILIDYSMATLLNVTTVGARALRNSDYADPVIKRTLLNLIMQAIETLSKVFVILSPILAMEGNVSFDRVAFILVGNFGDSPEMRLNKILSNIPANAISRFQNDLFSRKMGPLLIDRLNSENTDLTKHSLILLLIAQRPHEWKTLVQSYIVSVSKNSFYLMDVYRALMSQYLYSYASPKALEDIKYLLKMILVKHTYGVKEPGTKAISKISDKNLPSRETE
jgi:hypothetical protein